MPTEKERLATLEQLAKDAKKAIAEHWSILAGKDGLRGEVTMLKDNCERIEQHLAKLANGRQASKTRWVDLVFKVVAGLVILFVAYKVGWK